MPEPSVVLTLALLPFVQPHTRASSNPVRHSISIPYQRLSRVERCWGDAPSNAALAIVSSAAKAAATPARRALPQFTDPNLARAASARSAAAIHAKAVLGGCNNRRMRLGWMTTCTMHGGRKVERQKGMHLPRSRRNRSGGRHNPRQSAPHIGLVVGSVATTLITQHNKDGTGIAHPKGPATKRQRSIFARAWTPPFHPPRRLPLNLPRAYTTFAPGCTNRIATR